MVQNFTEIPSRMNDIWDWVVAFDAFDHGDRHYLAALIEGASEIPPEALPQLARIVSGDRRPNLKAAAKLKVPASERLKIAGSISTVVGLTNLIRTRAVLPDGFGGDAAAISVVADREGKETLSVARELEREARDAIAEAAEDLGVSVETIENLLRDLRRKIAAFPEI